MSHLPWDRFRPAPDTPRSINQSDHSLLADQTRFKVTLIFGFWSPNFNLDPVMASLDPKRASLILCHNPDALDESGWAGYQGWILSGHTHGGQCKPPFLSPPIIPVKNKRYTSGVIDLYDGRMMYINRGLGYLHRVRFNARPEITVFTLA